MLCVEVELAINNEVMNREQRTLKSALDPCSQFIPYRSLQGTVCRLARVGSRSGGLVRNEMLQCDVTELRQAHVGYNDVLTILS